MTKKKKKKSNLHIFHLNHLTFQLNNSPTTTLNYIKLVYLESRMINHFNGNKNAQNGVLKGLQSNVQSWDHKTGSSDKNSS